tara:strand:- start:10384 stop:10746 length:363 start_codon:yes stop_codon:yes gene_type:complete
MPTWPSSLDKLSLNTSEARGDGTIRTPMDAGIAKARRRFSAVPRAVSMSLILPTSSDRTTFDDFFSDTLSEGSLRFDFTDPIGGATVEARFSGPPSYTWRKSENGLVDFCVASFSLEILP